MSNKSNSSKKCWKEILHEYDKLESTAQAKACVQSSKQTPDILINDQTQRLTDETPLNKSTTAMVKDNADLIGDMASKSSVDHVNWLKQWEEFQAQPEHYFNDDRKQTAQNNATEFPDYIQALKSYYERPHGERLFTSNTAKSEQFEQIFRLTGGQQEIGSQKTETKQIKTKNESDSFEMRENQDKTQILTSKIRNNSQGNQNSLQKENINVKQKTDLIQVAQPQQLKDQLKEDTSNQSQQFLALKIIQANFNQYFGHSMQNPDENDSPIKTVTNNRYKDLSDHQKRINEFKENQFSANATEKEGPPSASITVSEFSSPDGHLKSFMAGAQRDQQVTIQPTKTLDFSKLMAPQEEVDASDAEQDIPLAARKRFFSNADMEEQNIATAQAAMNYQKQNKANYEVQEFKPRQESNAATNNNKVVSKKPVVTSGGTNNVSTFVSKIQNVGTTATVTTTTTNTNTTNLDKQSTVFVPSLNLADDNQGELQYFDPDHEPFVDHSNYYSARNHSSFYQNEKFHQKWKTELCRSLEVDGYCKFFPHCSYAHGTHELRAKANLPKNYKTKPCMQFFGRNYCPYGQRCQYLHSIDKPSQLSATTPGGGDASVTTQKKGQKRLEIGTASSPVSSRGRFGTVVHKLNDNTDIISLTSESEHNVPKSASTKPGNNEGDYDRQQVDEAVKIIKKSKRLAVFENILSGQSSSQTSAQVTNLMNSQNKRIRKRGKKNKNQKTSITNGIAD